jgi:hypothetical protein
MRSSLYEHDRMAPAPQDVLGHRGTPPAPRRPYVRDHDDHGRLELRDRACELLRLPSDAPGELDVNSMTSGCCGSAGRRSLLPSPIRGDDGETRLHPARDVRATAPSLVRKGSVNLRWAWAHGAALGRRWTLGCISACVRAREDCCVPVTDLPISRADRATADVRGRASHEPYSVSSTPSQPEQPTPRSS